MKKIGMILLLVLGVTATIYAAKWERLELGSNFECELPETATVSDDGKKYSLTHEGITFLVKIGLNEKFYNPKIDKDSIRDFHDGVISGLRKKLKAKIVQNRELYQDGFLGFHAVLKKKMPNESFISSVKGFYVGKQVAIFVLFYSSKLSKKGKLIKNRFFNSIKINADYLELAKKKSRSNISNLSPYEKGKLVGEAVAPIIVVLVILFFVIRKRKKKKEQNQAKL